MNVKDKLKEKKVAMKKRIVEELKGAESEPKIGIAKSAAPAAVATLFLFGLCGCQELLPSARSNRTEYGDIVRIEAGGYVQNVTVTIGDGTLASADGGGDSQQNTPKQDISPKTQLSYGIGTGGGSTWGELFSGIASMFSGKTEAATATPAAAASNDSSCVNGSCSEK